MRAKIIATDVDGVMLNWDRSFERWMAIHHNIVRNPEVTSYSCADRYGMDEDVIWELIEEFNRCDVQGYLPPFRDSLRGVRDLVAAGYRFIAVTSFGGNETSARWRRNLLRELFGNVFDEILILPLCGDKTAALTKLVGVTDYWIEDNLKNAMTGAVLGFRTYLMDAPYNQTSEAHPNIVRVASWKEIVADIVPQVG